MNDIVHAAAAPKAVGAYPHARRVGNLLFLSGVGPRRAADDSVPGNVIDAQGRLIDYDMEAQCRQVFDNVRSVLEASGARWQDLLDVTVFLTDMERDFATYNRVYAEYFTDAVVEVFVGEGGCSHPNGRLRQPTADHQVQREGVWPVRGTPGAVPGWLRIRQRRLILPL